MSGTSPRARGNGTQGQKSKSTQNPPRIEPTHRPLGCSSPETSPEFEAIERLIADSAPDPQTKALDDECLQACAGRDFPEGGDAAAEAHRRLFDADTAPRRRALEASLDQLSRYRAWSRAELMRLERRLDESDESVPVRDPERDRPWNLTHALGASLAGAISVVCVVGSVGTLMDAFDQAGQSPLVAMGTSVLGLAGPVGIKVYFSTCESDRQQRSALRLLALTTSALWLAWVGCVVAARGDDLAPGGADAAVGSLSDGPLDSSIKLIAERLLRLFSLLADGCTAGTAWAFIERLAARYRHESDVPLETTDALERRVRERRDRDERAALLHGRARGAIDAMDESRECYADRARAGVARLIDRHSLARLTARLMRREASNATPMPPAGNAGGARPTA